MKQLTLSVILCLLAFGCSEVRHDPVEAIPEVSEELSPEIAKAALISMLSERQGAMEYYKVEEWRNVPLERPKDGHYFKIGPFSVDLDKRKYTHLIGGQTLGGENWFREEAGQFIIEKNKWIATPPQHSAHSR